MNRRAAQPIVYVDRASGEERREQVYARGFLDWLYNSRSGSWLAALLTRSPHASQFYGWLQSLRWSRRRIRPFVARMGIDMTESLQPLGAFTSFADFFVRELRPGARPVAAGDDLLVAPADGRVLVREGLTPEEALEVKRSRFRLLDLLRDPELAACFAGGSLAIVRLGLGDYHHVHFPDSGVPGELRSIPGGYHAGGPYARGWRVPFFATNHRMVTPFAADHFGLLALVEVGALTVGSILQSFRPGQRVRKGEHKACFALGGSTVVLVFQRGAVRFDPDLVAWSARGLEVQVRAGERLGVAAARGR